MKMCETCWNAVQKWCGTAFPAGCDEQVDQQLQELEKKSNGNYEDAMTITHQEFDEIWERTRHLRARWDKKEQRWIEPEELAAQPGS